MTNAQIAHKMGLDKVPHQGWEYREAMERSGLTVSAETKTLLNLECFEGELEFDRGTLHIFCGTNGTARIDKPNGSHKWVYEKTPAQISAQLLKIIEFYK